MAVGVKCPREYADYLYGNAGYCFIEPTAPTVITDNRSDYLGVGKLQSQLKVIPVSDGLSLNSVWVEYDDVGEWYRL